MSRASLIAAALPSGGSPDRGADRATVGLISLGVGLAAAGVGAALGVAAERLAAGRPLLPPHGQNGAGGRPGEDYGSLHSPPLAVAASDGTVLHVEIDEEVPASGARDEPVTIVFSHGFALSEDSWHFQRQALRQLPDGRLGGRRIRVVYWDQRGHGESMGGVPEAATIDQLGDDLERVIERTAPTGPLILVGHSMGGMTVMSLAQRRGDLFRERVIGVVLAATSAGGLGETDLGLDRLGKFVLRSAPSAAKVLGRAHGLVDRGRALGSDLEAVLVRRYSYASPVPRALVAFTARMIAETRFEVLASFLPALTGHDKRTALQVMSGCEVLIIAGADDVLIPAEHSARIAEELPEAEHMVIQRAGHMLMLEHPEAFNTDLVEFFTATIELRAPREAPAGAAARKRARRRLQQVTQAVTPIRRMRPGRRRPGTS